MLFIMFSLCISIIVLYRLFSILRSYIRRRSRTLACEKSFIMVWPSEVWGLVVFWLLERRDCVSLAMGL